MEAGAANWVPVVGGWSIRADAITYTGPHDERNRYGVVMSSMQMYQGVIRVTIKPAPDKEAARVLIGYSPRPGDYVTAGIGGYGKAWTLDRYEPGLGWRMLQGAGRAQDLEPERQYEIEVRIAGQRIELKVDGIAILQDVLEHPLGGRQVGLFAWGSGRTEFSIPTIEQQLPLAFALMPLSTPFLELYRDVVSQVAEKLGFVPRNALELHGPGIIMKEILENIVEAEILVAEISTPNPNVYYELGYASALNKPIILLAREDTRLPFDISGFRVIFYEDSIAGKKQIEGNLEKHLKAIKQGR